MNFRTTGGLCLLAALWMPASRPAMAATPEQVDAAINRLTAHLYSLQRDGTWESVSSPVTSKKINDVKGNDWGGYTVLAADALLAAGENPQDPKLSKAIDFLKTAQLQGIYCLGLRCQVWAQLPQTAEIRGLLAKDGTAIVGAVKTADAEAGMYNYIPDGPKGRYDHSNSQYAVLGAWACADCDLEVPTNYWKLVDQGWRNHQEPDGGWLYMLHKTVKLSNPKAMTAAGIATLFLTDDYLVADAGVDCHGNIHDQNIELGMQWMQKHIRETDPCEHNYTLYGIERIGVASGYKYIGDVDWFKTAADDLVKFRGASLPDASFALLVLARGRAPVMMNKLQYALDTHGDTPKEANWNQRPRDAANLAHWAGKENERFLNWQIVNLRVSPDDLHDAPVLYMSGNQELSLSDTDLDKLRLFIEQGGLILGNADCSAPAFAGSFKRLGQKMFPLYEFRTLPGDHPIYTKEQYLRSEWKNPPRVEALSNGCRELMILVPDADVGRSWQLRASHTQGWAFQLADDIFQYSMGRQSLRYKGDTYIVQANPNVPTKRTVTIARLMAGPNWNPEPGGWRRMAAILHNTMGLDVQTEAVPLGEGKLKDQALAHLTGTTPFHLRSQERAELKQYVDSGGTLLIDAAGGSSEFAKSAEAELANTFGDEAKQLDHPLPLDNPIYQGIPADNFAYRIFARAQRLGNLRDPRLRGIELNGRLAVIYSPEDLSVGMMGSPVDGVYGYDPKTVAALMSRIVSDSRHLSPSGSAARSARGSAGSVSSNPSGGANGPAVRWGTDPQPQNQDSPPPAPMPPKDAGPPQ